MNTSAFDDREEDWDAPYGEGPAGVGAAGEGPYGEGHPYGEGPDRQGPAEEAQLPPRPRRRFLNAGTVTLLALVTAAAGFLGGIEVEKGRASSSPTSALAGLGARASAFAARFGGATGAGASGSSGRAGAGTSSSRLGSGEFPGAAAAGFGGLGGGQAGTVSSLNGKTLYLTTTSGNTVKVTLSSVTKVTKSEGVTRNKIHPGDEISVRGLTKSNGTVVATAVTDSGASAAGSSGSGSSSSGSSDSGSGSSGSGGVSSLFNSGG